MERLLVKVVVLLLDVEVLSTVVTDEVSFPRCEEHFARLIVVCSMSFCFLFVYERIIIII